MAKGYTRRDDVIPAKERRAQRKMKTLLKSPHNLRDQSWDDYDFSHREIRYNKGQKLE